MPFSISVLLTVYFSTLLPSAPAPPMYGVTIVSRQITGNLSDIKTEYLTPDRLRNEWAVQGDRPLASIVRRGERDRVFVLDLNSHEYITYETDSRGAALGMRSRPVANSGGVLQIWIENIDTGERKEMFGHTARHIITREKRMASPGACSKGSETETDGWYIDESVMPEWRRNKKDSVGLVVASTISTGAHDACFNKTDKIEVHRSGGDPGLPVKMITTLKSEVPQPDGHPRTLTSTWGSEIMELKEGPLDPSLFEVPADFKLVAALKNWTTAPARQLTGWEWFKERLQEMFR